MAVSLPAGNPIKRDRKEKIATEGIREPEIQPLERGEKAAQKKKFHDGSAGHTTASNAGIKSQGGNKKKATGMITHQQQKGKEKGEGKKDAAGEIMIADL